MTEEAEVGQGVHQYIRLHKGDNVVVLLQPLTPGEVLGTSVGSITVKDHIPTGHKMAIITIPMRGMVIKYGEEIGEATETIETGQHVHVHNVRDITAEVSVRERRRLGL
jgi:hypothetical protein